MGADQYAIREQYGSEIYTLATQLGAVKHVVGFDLREGGPLVVALLGSPTSQHSYRVLPNLWQFDDAASNTAALACTSSTQSDRIQNCANASGTSTVSPAKNASPP